MTTVSTEDLTPKSQMSTVGPGPIVEEHAQSIPHPNLSLGEQLQVAYPEGEIVGDEGNPEFKLPRTGSLVVVLMTNVLIQVTLRIPPAQRTYR